jgi:hypothetical protein
MVIFNNRIDAKRLHLSRFKENLKNYKTGKEVLTDTNIYLTQEIILEPKSVLLLELNK